jgi:hypothetical protein
MSDPASASALAIPNPMPLLPPVTIDILLSKRNFSIMIYSISIKLSRFFRSPVGSFVF